MKKVHILSVMILLSQSSWAQIREFQTTRLNSTAGTGVASVLATEAAILNPAGSALFDGSSFSYQSYSTSLRHESKDRDILSDDFANRNKSQGVFVSDHSGSVKGGVAYLDQQENNYERKQMVLHSAAPLGGQSAMGVTYRYIQDTLPKSASRRHFVRHQATIGTMHILDESTIVGLLLIDPTRATPGEERLIAGFQYNLSARFTLLADIGTQYTKDIKDKYLWRGAVQLTLFDDFFFRIGKFYDNVRETKGTGWGVGWVGPRLGIEFAQKISDQFGRSNYIYKNESLVDTSLSAMVRF